MALQQDLDTLNAAIASGERQVVIGNESVTFNTTDSLLRARDDVQRRLVDEAARARGRLRPKQRYVQFKGREY
jgi:hypothetical protein